MNSFVHMLKTKILGGDKDFSELIQVSSVAFTIKLLSAGITFGFNVYLARILGAEGAGIYVMAYTVIIVGSTLGQAGMPSPLVKYIAANASKNNWEKVKGVYKQALTISILVSGIIALLIFYFAPLICDKILSEPKLINPLRLMVFALVPHALFILNSNALKGLKKITESMIVFILLCPMLTFIGSIVLSPEWGIIGVVSAFIISAISTLLFGVWRWRVYTRNKKSKAPYFNAKILFSSSMPMFWVATQQLALSWSSTFILGIYTDSAKVGIFNAAQRTAMLVSFILIAVNSIASPKFASMYYKNEFFSLEKLAKNCTKLMLIAAMPSLIIFIFFSRFIMGLFGHEFIDGALILTILAVGQFVNVATGAVSALLAMTDNEIIWRNITAISAVINVALNFLLIPKLGVVGAAISTSFSISIQMIIAVFFAWRKLGILTIPIGYRSKLDLPKSA